jgi:hypothetical protein
MRLSNYSLVQTQLTMHIRARIKSKLGVWDGFVDYVRQRSLDQIASKALETAIAFQPLDFRGARVILETNAPGPV